VTSDELIELALRVVSACAITGKVDPEDVRMLRASVTGPEAGWEPDVLASFIIQRELKERTPRTKPSE
jgi:hypothetical protein